MRGHEITLPHPISKKGSFRGTLTSVNLLGKCVQCQRKLTFLSLFISVIVNTASVLIVWTQLIVLESVLAHLMHQGTWVVVLCA